LKLAHRSPKFRKEWVSETRSCEAACEMADRQRTRDIFGNSLLTFQGKPRQRFGPSISARGDRVGLGTECPTLRRHRVNPFRFQGAPQRPPPCVAIAAGLREISKSRALRRAGGSPDQRRKSGTYAQICIRNAQITSIPERKHVRAGKFLGASRQDAFQHCEQSEAVAGRCSARRRA